MWQPKSSSSNHAYQSPAKLEQLQRRKRRRNITYTKETLITSEFEPQSLVIKDHNGDDVNMVWCPKYYNDDPPETLPPFPFQVYLTHGAKEAIRDIAGFAERFACFVEWIGGVSHWPQQLTLAGYYYDGEGRLIGPNGEEDCHYRFEVYSKPQSNILACIEHQRREVRRRRRNAIWPSLVPEWTTDDYGWRGRIIVIDRDDWAEAGVILAAFDPAQYVDPTHYGNWITRAEGNHSIVDAHRVCTKSLLAERKIDPKFSATMAELCADFSNSLVLGLRQYWLRAGHTWKQADLARRNAGTASPVFYPAVDPTSHYDVEHQDVDDLDDSSLPDPSLSPSSIDPTTGEPLVVDTCVKDELFKRGPELGSLRSESYSDNFGLPVTSVWDPSLSSLRPLFAVTIYLSFDMIPIESKALFSCLNKGLLVDGAWTLDVIRNMPNLEAALDYHAHSSTRRSALRTSGSGKVLDIVLSKVAGYRLPAELIDYIKELLLPPEIPNYSCPPGRRLEHMFMYLDSKSLRSGPKIIYFGPTSFSPDIHTVLVPVQERDRSTSVRLRGPGRNHVFLQMVDLGYWNRVAEAIHVLWSFCSPRLALSPADMPRVLVILRVPGQFSSGDSLEVIFWFDLHSAGPITVPVRTLSYELKEMFEVVDLETGDSLPINQDENPNLDTSMDSWSQWRQLGYHGQTFKTIEPSSGETLRKNMRIVRPLALLQSSLDEMGLLVDGHRYRVSLRPDVTIPRWTYGTPEETCFNLPPIPVVMSEESQTISRYFKSER